MSNQMQKGKIYNSGSLEALTYGRIVSDFSFNGDFVIFPGLVDVHVHLREQGFCFGNEVCLRQMMLALPMMTAAPNDVCLTAH